MDVIVNRGRTEPQLVQLEGAAGLSAQHTCRNREWAGNVFLSLASVQRSNACAAAMAQLLKPMSNVTNATKSVPFNGTVIHLLYVTVFGLRVISEEMKKARKAGSTSRALRFLGGDY